MELAYSVIAISAEDKVRMLNLLSDFQKRTGKRQSFGKFMTVLLDSYETTVKVM